MFPEKLKKYKWYGVIFLITLIIVMFIRVFLMESYTVSSSQMEPILYDGDKVLVDKTAYGIRMPITVLSIPFTFDSFLGFRPYSDLIQLGYRRIFIEKVNRDDIVLYNNPLEIQKPLDRRQLFLSRCVAVPGDTIQVMENDLFINGKKYMPSSDFLMTFHYDINNKSRVDSVMNLFKIPIRNQTTDSIYGYISLNRYEAFILKQKLPQLSLLEFSENSQSYIFIIPAKKSLVKLTSHNILLYKDIIAQEQDKDSIKIESGKILKNGIELKAYEFENDYYWFMSDNPDKANDSRTLGFISERCLVGKAFFIWFGSGKGKGGRTFSSIK